MPTTAELALILRFKDQASAAVKQAAQSIQQALQGIGQAIESAGVGLRRFSRDLIQVGAVVTGPFLLAFHTAASRIPEVRDAVRAMTNELIDFQLTIARDTLPIVQSFTNWLHSLRIAFEQLDPETRRHILQLTLLTGAFILVAGTIGRFVAQVLIAIGLTITWITSLNPVVLVIGALITAVVACMVAFQGWEKTWMGLARAIDVALEAMKAFVDMVFTGIFKSIAFLAEGLARFYDALGHLPGRLGETYRQAAIEVRKFKDEMDALTGAAAQSAAVHLDTVTVRMKQGGGAVETTVRNISDVIKLLKGSLAELGNTFANTTNWADLWKTFWTSFSDISTRSFEIVKSTITDLEGRFTTIFNKIITQGGKAKDAFKAFGQAILETIAMMIAKFLAMAAVLLILNAIPGGVAFLKAADKMASLFRFHQGGYVGALSARSSYHTGGEVLAALQPGEFVMNKEATAKNRGLLEQMNNGAAGGGSGANVQNVFIIQAIDEASFRGKLQTHADLIEAMFQRAIKRNSGPMREAVRI